MPTEVWRELAEIADALLALPDDAFEERAALTARRDRLRAEARAAVSPDDDRSTDDLLAEFDEVTRRVRAVIGRRINLVSQAGSSLASGAGADGWGGVELNRAMDEAAGLDRLQARMRRLREVLADRGVPADRLSGDHSAG